MGGNDGRVLRVGAGCVPVIDGRVYRLWDPKAEIFGFRGQMLLGRGLSLEARYPEDLADIVGIIEFRQCGGVGWGVGGGRIGRPDDLAGERTHGRIP